jgi:hypothetical protein
MSLLGSAPLKLLTLAFACLTVIQEYRNILSMKATIDIPDELYRQVKARSAMEGRPLRAVAMELFQNWLAAPRETVSKSLAVETTAAPWLAITRPYLKPGMKHDMESIRAAIAKGRAGDSQDGGKSTQP